MRDSTIFYRSFYEAISTLPTAEERDNAYRAIFELSLNLNEVEITGPAKGLMIAFTPIIKANTKRWESGNKEKKKQDTSEQEAKHKQERSKSEANKDKDKDKDKDKNKELIPTPEEFLNFCKTIPGINYKSLEFSLKAKYEAFISDGWRDGNGNKIKNWKSKIKNIIPHLKPMQAAKEETRPRMIDLPSRPE